MNSLLISMCYEEVKMKDDQKNCKNFSAMCRFCLPKRRRVAGNVTSTTNFLNHIKEHHGQQYLKYKATKDSSSSKKRKMDNDAAVEASTTDPKRQFMCQTTVSESFGKCTAVTKMTQSDFEDNLTRMLVQDMQPLATVERNGFQKFVSTVLPQFKIPSCRTMRRRLNDVYETEKESLMSMLSKTRWLSATADLWSAHKRAYMGVTIHFIHPETLQMVSSALACRRFKGEHTGTKIAHVLAGIFEEFEIATKLQNVVTDNASNFAKAFSLFSSRNDHDDEETQDENEDAMWPMLVMNLEELLDSSNTDESDEAPILPPHKRCGNHSLNLVASSDAREAREDKAYQRSYDRAMSKVQALSNAVSRSPKANDTVEDITGKTFIRPVCTRWCSEYYTVERVVEIGLEKVVECQQALGQNPMTQADFKFLNSFIIVMRPVVFAMKLLEGENNCYIGQLIPTIMGLQHKLELASNDLSMKPLTTALLRGITKRFQAALESEEYRIATILHPRFKLSFLPDDQARMQGRELLLAFVQQVQREVAGPSTTPSESASTEGAPDNEDLYSFLNIIEQSGSTLSDEVSGYLASKSVIISSLLSYPAVAEAFRKSNATLPSSAAVERLFSAASQVLSARRCRMSDETLDKLVFLQSRLKYTT